MTSAFAYLRVSGRGQIDGDGFPRQISAIEQYAAANRISIAKTFREEGVCGATEWDSRPAWLEMVSNLNGVRTIIIERLDRLARDLMVQEHILADLRRREITLISVHEPDLGSEEPSRVLMRQIMGAIAQYDRAMIVLKLRAARQRVKARDGRCEGRKPYGVMPGEREVVDRARALRLTGLSYDAIATVLNDQGLKPRAGKKWWGKGVSRMLAPNVVKGEARGE